MKAHNVHACCLETEIWENKNIDIYFIKLNLSKWIVTKT